MAKNMDEVRGMIRPGDVVALPPEAFWVELAAVRLWDRAWEDPRGCHRQTTACVVPHAPLLVLAVPAAQGTGAWLKQSMLVLTRHGQHGWLHGDECRIDKARRTSA